MTATQSIQVQARQCIPRLARRLGVSLEVAAVIWCRKYAALWRSHQARFA